MKTNTHNRPCCLAVAGFDPSGGAGLLADIKTFEANKVLGFGVVSGLTYQNDSEFEGVKWIEPDEIFKQIVLLEKKNQFDFVKIGLVRDFEFLETLVDTFLMKSSECRIVWDPILKASAGFNFHQSIGKEKFLSICKKIFLVTPNLDEIKILMNENDEKKAANELSKYCNVYLKGGHQEEKPGKDYLFAKDGKVFPFRPKKISGFSKHGGGCVLSSAITSNLAKGEPLHRSCLKAKNYITEFLMSNKTLLGYHKI